MSTDNQGMLMFLVGGIIALLIYMSPAMVATYRKHPQQNAIYVLTMLGGWTLLGWIGAWVWAFTNPSTKSNATPQGGADTSNRAQH